MHEGWDRRLTAINRCKRLANETTAVRYTVISCLSGSLQTPAHYLHQPLASAATRQIAQHEALAIWHCLEGRQDAGFSIMMGGTVQCEASRSHRNTGGTVSLGCQSVTGWRAPAPVPVAVLMRISMLFQWKALYSASSLEEPATLWRLPCTPESAATLCSRGSIPGTAASETEW